MSGFPESLDYHRHHVQCGYPHCVLGMILNTVLRFWAQDCFKNQVKFYHFSEILSMIGVKFRHPVNRIVYISSALLRFGTSIHKNTPTTATIIQLLPSHCATWQSESCVNKWRILINYQSAGTELYRFHLVTIMTADALAPYVARTSAAMILTV